MKKGIQYIYAGFGAFMIILVLTAAILFTFTDFMSDRLYGGKRTAFIIILLAYGVYRGYRMYSTLKRPGNED